MMYPFCCSVSVVFSLGLVLTHRVMRLYVLLAVLVVFVAVEESKCVYKL